MYSLSAVLGKNTSGASTEGNFGSVRCVPGTSVTCFASLKYVLAEDKDKFCPADSQALRLELINAPALPDPHGSL